MSHGALLAGHYNCSQGLCWVGSGHRASFFSPSRTLTLPRLSSNLPCKQLRESFVF